MRFLGKLLTVNLTTGKIEREEMKFPGSNQQLRQRLVELPVN